MSNSERGGFHVTERIASFLKGSLDPVSSAEVAGHLATCASCEMMASAIGHLQASVAVDAALRVPASVWAQVDAWEAASPVARLAGSFTSALDAAVRSVSARTWGSLLSGEGARMAGLTVASLGVTALLLADGGAARQALVRNLINVGYYTDASGNQFGGYFDDVQSYYGYSAYGTTSTGGGSSGGGSSSSDSGSTTTTTTTVAAPVAAPASVVTVAVPGVPGLKVSLSAGEAKNLQAGLASAPPAALQSFNKVLGGLSPALAGATLKLVASVPADQAGKLISSVSALPAAQAGALLSGLAGLPAAEAGAMIGTASTLPAADAAAVFSAVADLFSAGGSVRFAVPGELTRGANGVDAVTYNFDDGGATAGINLGNADVAGVSQAAGGRTVLVVVKPGQQARMKRGKSGAWPNIALPVTAGPRAGLTPIVSPPADATDVWFEPVPATANEVQRGSLGGGSVIPLSPPFAITVAGSKGKVGFSLPSIAVAPTMEFGYLTQANDAKGAFVGYTRADAKFVPATGRQEFDVNAADLGGAFMLPAAFQPAYVQNFSEGLRIYSGWDDKAADFGAAGPQFTTFKVVAPQIGNRIYVFNPVTGNYGWANADGVGPSGPPK